MKVINYPRNRPLHFALLGGMVLAFIAGFFWSPLIADRDVAMMAFIGNIAAIGAFGIWLAGRFRRVTHDDILRVQGSFPQVDSKEREIIEKRNLSCTVHAVEAWSREQGKHFREYFVEFHTDEDKMLFLLARPSKRAA
jgi:hypothetical protein